MLKLNVFVGKPSNPAIGGWITLPLSQDKLNKEVRRLVPNEEFIISDIDTNLPIINKLLELGNITEINEAFKALQQIYLFEINEDLSLLSIVLDLSSTIEEAIELLESGNYEYFPNVSDERALGEYIVNQDILEIPDNLVNYIDYAAIGRDWRCDGTVINSGLSCAIKIYK